MPLALITLLKPCKIKPVNLQKRSFSLQNKSRLHGDTVNKIALISPLPKFEIEFVPNKTKTAVPNDRRFFNAR